MELSTRTGDDTTLKAVPLVVEGEEVSSDGVSRSFAVDVFDQHVAQSVSSVVCIRNHTIICMVHKVTHDGYIYALFTFLIFYPHSGKQYTMACMYSMYAMFYIVCVCLSHVDTCITVECVCVYTV